MVKKNRKGPAVESASATLIEILMSRFESNMHRHKGLQWSDLEARLTSNAKKLRILEKMEQTGGEPDVIGMDKGTGEYIVVDCAPETPQGRRGVCYDREGLESRKEHRPVANAVDMAASMGIQLLSEQDYQDLQKLGPFDTKTSSWLLTPPEVREHGGAIFGDFRYGRTFIYHNGAQSYYAVRGFRGSVRI